MLEWMAIAEWLALGYLALHLVVCVMLRRRTGRALNPMLGLTAMLMLLVSIVWLGTVIAK